MNITDKEREILNLVRQGLTDNEISSIIYKSPSAVEKIVTAMRERFGCANRPALVNFAHENKLINEENLNNNNNRQG